MRNNAVTNQAPSTVSLADAPARLRSLSEALRGVAWLPGVNEAAINEERTHLLALASSLEQLQPVTNTNSDQVTITLSREDAHVLWMGAEGLRHLEAGASLNTYECGNPDAWRRIAGAAYVAYRPHPKEKG